MVYWGCSYWVLVDGFGCILGATSINRYKYNPNSNLIANHTKIHSKSLKHRTTSTTQFSCPIPSVYSHIFLLHHCYFNTATTTIALFFIFDIYFIYKTEGKG